MQVFTDGITNKLIGCFYNESPSDVILVRVYGTNTDLLIDRKAETATLKVRDLNRSTKSGLAMWACYQILCFHLNTVTLRWIPGYWGFLGTEHVDQLAKKRSMSTIFYVPKTSCGEAGQRSKLCYKNGAEQKNLRVRDALLCL